jgi:hypothetical protein
MPAKEGRVTADPVDVVIRDSAGAIVAVRWTGDRREEARAWVEQHRPGWTLGREYVGVTTTAARVEVCKPGGARRTG